MNTIKVDLDDLMQKIKLVEEDGYLSVIIGIQDDGYGSELVISAQGIDDDEPIDYGAIPEESDDFM